MQVRHEDKYRGLIPTFLTAWKDSTSLFGLVSFLIWLVFKERGIQGFFDGTSLRLPQDIFFGDWVGGVRISLGIRADKEPIKVLYSPKLYLPPLPKSITSECIVS